MRNLTAPARACAILMTLALFLPASFLPRSTYILAATQEVTPAGTLAELAIDDGTADCVLGLPAELIGQPGFGWVNKLTPATYPATLRAITIGFSRSNTGREVKPDTPYRIVVYTDPEKDGPANGQPPAAHFIGRVRGLDQSIMTFTLATPLTIDSGSFVVGAIDEFGVASQPALNDVPGKSNPPGSDSFFTFDGGAHWQRFSDVMLGGTPPCNQSGSFLIRATVESNPVDAFTVTKIQDPLAVEPWGVATNSDLAFVTNYVSDNLTVVNVANNTIQNVPLGDGPGGTADGPFGIAAASFNVTGGPVETRAYVTLFGSNTIPTKEFPVDYSAVGPGRVVVLKGQFGSVAPTLTINVGKGPRFPAFATVDARLKLYVPCGGANRVDVIDTTTNTKVAEIPVGLDPSSCTVFNNSKVYVTNFGDGSISVIDPKTDRKIKDIPAPHVTLPTPAGSTTPPAAPLLTNPWKAAVSQANGQLYVTYWGTAGNVFPNGAIAEFDTCKDEFVRATLDEQTRGTPPGSAGASGIVAPTAPLTRDATTGLTPGAGGGGGGPFGLVALGESAIHPLVFTNDGAGIIGLLDTRIDQVTSSPLLGLSSCPKPRGIAGTVDPSPIPPVVGLGPGRIAYVACGQPDNAILVFKVPAQTQPIKGLPVIESVSFGNKLNIRGSGFTRDIIIQIIAPESTECLGFNNPPKLQDGGTRLQQKGKLTDGRKPGKIGGARIRLILPDGTVILLSPPFPGAT